MTAPGVLKSLKSDGWPDRIHAGKAVIRFPDGTESGNWYSRPSLNDDRTTEYTRAPTPVAAAMAVPEVVALVEALKPFVDALDATNEGYGFDISDHYETANMVCQPYIKMSHFKAARAALAAMKGGAA